MLLLNDAALAEHWLRELELELLGVRRALVARLARATVLADDRPGVPLSAALHKALRLLRDERLRGADAFHVLDSTELAIAAALHTRPWVLIASVGFPDEPVVVATTIRETAWANEPPALAETTPPPALAALVGDPPALCSPVLTEPESWRLARVSGIVRA